MHFKSDSKSHVTNSTYAQTDKQLQTLTTAFRIIAGASVVSMFLSIAAAMLVIFAR